MSKDWTAAELQTASEMMKSAGHLGYEEFCHELTNHKEEYIMMNLNEMTSKQLKELGKEYHVKNWWNLSKSALISALSEIVNKKNDHEPEPENVEINEVEPNTLIETDPPEKVVAFVEPEAKTKKPNLKIHDLTFEGKTQSIRKWAEELEMPWPTLYDRINRNGWTVEEALTIPLGGRRTKK